MSIDDIREKGRPAEILLVEDNEGDVVLTREAFKAAKLRNNLNVVTDGEMALQFLNKNPPFESAPTPDLILLDLNLPKLDGREVLNQIKSDTDLRRIPVIVITSSNAETDVVKSYNLHANAYVTKPVDLQSFENIVQALEHFWFEVVVYANE